MGIIDKCGVRGDATLCVVIFKCPFDNTAFAVSVVGRLGSRKPVLPHPFGGCGYPN